MKHGFFVECQQGLNSSNEAAIIQAVKRTLAMKIHIFPTARQVVERLANEMVALAQLNRPVHISLSGGSTPSRLFSLLSSEPFASSIEWKNLHFWWGDERCVAPDDSQSNFAEANKRLFSQVEIPTENIHRILGENEPEQEAIRFSQEMVSVIPCENGVPVFDWILLGMGSDGHTASLFPGQTHYDETALAVVASHPESDQLRLSKTVKTLAAAKRISYLVLGAAKADTVRDIVTQSPESLSYPAARIRSLSGTTDWYMDEAAAAKI